MNVTVDILDVNDNTPTITVQPHMIPLSESASSGPLPVIITVTDEDSNENAEVEYTLSNDGGLFSVSSSGVITLVGSLDREMEQQYNISITVTDQLVS